MEEKERTDLGKQRGGLISGSVLAPSLPAIAGMWSVIPPVGSRLQGGGVGCWPPWQGCLRAELGLAALHVQDEAIFLLLLLLPLHRVPPCQRKPPYHVGVGRSVSQDIGVNGPLWWSVFSCAAELHRVLISFLLDQITLFL